MMRAFPEGTPGAGHQDPGDIHLLRQVAENLREVFWLVEWSDPPRILYVSPAYEQVWGYDAEPLYQDAVDWLRHVHPEDRPAVLNFLRVLAAGEDVRGHYRIVRPDGSLRWIWQQTFHIRGDSEAPGRCVGLSLDVTEQKEREIQLRLSHEVLQQLPYGVIVTDTSGRIQQWIGNSESVLGYSRDEVVGADLGCVFPETPQQALAAISGGAEAGSARFAFCRQDGREIMLETVSRTISATGDMAAVVVHIVKDISGQVQAEAERLALDHKVQQAQKLESMVALAGGVAHDFNNILAAILGHVEVALQSLHDQHTVTMTLQEILVSVRRASDLANQMHAYASRSLFASGLLNLAELVASVCGGFRTTLAKGSLDVQCAADAPRVLGDAAQLRQLLVNLLTNAFESSCEAGQVRVRVFAREMGTDDLQSPYLPGPWREGRYACIEVIDHGCGMDLPALERLFDPFYSTKFAGRGLGLAAVLGIVRRHGGLITVASALHQGSRFFVAIPAADAGSSEFSNVSVQTGAAERDQRRILFVDDDTQVRSAFSRLLRSRGYEVIEAADGEAAVDLFRRAGSAIGCIILDLSMPKLDGWQALQRIRAIDRDVPVIIATGFSHQAIDVDETYGMANAFLHKPFQLNTLLKTIQEVSGKSIAGTGQGGTG